jgi:SAM-dependent methyltransferase
MAGPRYTYGDSDLAAERLALVADVFEPATQRFLGSVPHDVVGLAVDLGCGPGLTTRLLQRVLTAQRTVGLDLSDAFVQRARSGAPPGVTFARHDVTVVPFPLERAPDVVYARLLVAHLADPEAVVARWVDAVAPGGVVLVDDLESIDADEPAFRAYLDEVALPVVKAQGGALFVGPRLHAMADPDGATRVADQLETFTPAAATSARLFEMNLAVLVDRGEVGPSPGLAASLRAIATGERAVIPATWRVRQIGFRRG